MSGEETSHRVFPEDGANGRIAGKHRESNGKVALILAFAEHECHRNVLSLIGRPEPDLLFFRHFFPLCPSLCRIAPAATADFWSSMPSG